MILKACGLSFIILGFCVGCRGPSEMYGDLRYATVVSKNPNVAAVKPWGTMVDEQLSKRYQLIYLLSYEFLVVNNSEEYAKKSPMIFLLKDERLVTRDATKKYAKVFLLDKNLAIIPRRGVHSYDRGSVEWCQRIEMTLFVNGSGLVPCSWEWTQQVTNILSRTSY